MVRGTNPGTPWVNQTAPNEWPVLNGVFQFGGSFRLADIKDGTSNTIAVYEDMHWRGFYAGNTTIFDRQPTPDSNWMSSLSAAGNLRNPINNRNVAWGAQGGADDPRCHCWGSMHPGGANACLADGSVRFYSETIDRFLQYSLATRSGGESIANP